MSAVPFPLHPGRRRGPYDPATLQHGPLSGGPADPVVLLIDDEPRVATALEHALRHEAVRLHYCGDPAEGARMVEDLGATVVLLDHTLPRTVVQSTLAALLPLGVPIIVLCARRDPKRWAELLHAGAADCMVKLPERVELITRLNLHHSGHVARRACHQLQARLDNLTNTDQTCAETGLPGESTLRAHLALEWRRAHRQGSSLSLVVARVDHHEARVASAGEAAAQAVLQQVGALMGATARRPGDLVARAEGGTFALVLSNADPDFVLGVAEQLRQQTGATVRSGDTPVTLSVGVVTRSPGLEGSPDQLYLEAAAALRASERQGRDRVTSAA